LESLGLVETVFIGLKAIGGRWPPNGRRKPASSRDCCRRSLAGKLEPPQALARFEA